MLLSGRRAATEQAFGPLGGNRVPTVYSAKKSPTDSRVGVGVSAAHNRVHHGFLQVLRMGKLPEDVAERRQNPALLVDVVGRGCDSSALDGTKQATIHFHVFGPACDAAIEFPGIALCTNGLGNRHCEQRVGLPTNRMRMSDRRVLARPLGHPSSTRRRKPSWLPRNRTSGALPACGPATTPSRNHPSGCPAIVFQVPPAASSRTPSGYSRQICSDGWNSTRLPSASPASWPRRHPWARMRTSVSCGIMRTLSQGRP